MDTLIDTLRIYADMMRGITVKPEAMRAAVLQGFATATDLADYLVKKGLPFRDSHEAVAQAVRHAEQAGCGLEDLPLTVLQGFSALIENDVYQVLTPEGSLKWRLMLEKCRLLFGCSGSLHFSAARILPCPPLVY